MWHAQIEEKSERTKKKLGIDWQTILCFPFDLKSAQSSQNTSIALNNCQFNDFDLFIRIVFVYASTNL